MPSNSRLGSGWDLFAGVKHLRTAQLCSSTLQHLPGKKIHQNRLRLFSSQALTHAPPRPESQLSLKMLLESISLRHPMTPNLESPPKSAFQSTRPKPPKTAKPTRPRQTIWAILKTKNHPRRTPSRALPATGHRKSAGFGQGSKCACALQSCCMSCKSATWRVGFLAQAGSGSGFEEYPECGLQRDIIVEIPKFTPLSPSHHPVSYLALTLQISSRVMGNW